MNADLSALPAGDRQVCRGEKFFARQCHVGATVNWSGLRPVVHRPWLPVFKIQEVADLCMLYVGAVPMFPPVVIGTGNKYKI